MDNGEMLVVIKQMFEQSTEKMEKKFDAKADEVKRHTAVLVENLEKKVETVAEGHSILNNKLDVVKEELDLVKEEINGVKQEVNVVKQDVKSLKSDMKVVKNYVISVDTKLNEHEIILKRAK